jgi:cytidylate kinase
VDVLDGSAVARLAAEISIDASADAIRLDGVDVTDAIRRRDVTARVPVLSAHPQVRAALLDLQRRAARDGDVVMEGRDIGTRVLPDADVKVFLTASLDERTRRRGRELEIDDPGSLEELKRSIATRDRHDASRAESPLAQASGAVAIDTTGRTIEDVTAEIVELVRKQSA